MTIENWMCWEGGVDLVGMTSADMPQPNVIVHLARVVHTPLGSAPSGLVFYAPDPSAPLAAGFVCPNVEVGAYYGPHIFAGTPFEHAPVIVASIEVQVSKEAVTSRLEIPGFVFETRLSNLGPLESFTRPAGSPMPFAQQNLEARAGAVELRVNGELVSLSIPDPGISGGYGAVYSPCGIYSR